MDNIVKMNVSKIKELISNVHYSKCSFTQDIFFSGITNNWPQEYVDVGGKVKSELYYVGPIIHYYQYILGKEDTFCKWELSDYDRPALRKWLNEKKIPYKYHRSNITKFIKYLVESYGIVSIDVDDCPSNFDNGQNLSLGKEKHIEVDRSHCFVLVFIDGKIYIVDSYASLRKTNIRIFDFESFNNYVTSGDINSYNKVFQIANVSEIHLSQENVSTKPKEVVIEISVSESLDYYNNRFRKNIKDTD